MKSREIMGYVLLIMSGCLYTFERFLAMYKWSIDVSTGSFLEIPAMPSILDNIFVPTLFLIGLLLLISNFLMRRKESF